MTSNIPVIYYILYIRQAYKIYEHGLMILKGEGFIIRKYFIYIVDTSYTI